MCVRVAKIAVNSFACQIETKSDKHERERMRCESYETRYTEVRDRPCAGALIKPIETFWRQKFPENRDKESKMQKTGKNCRENDRNER